FELVFPGSPTTNALLATSYISILPNILLYFVPKEIESSTLSLLFHFAGGNLLGDLFLHLLPHVFGAQTDDKNRLMGIGLFLGVFLFYATDKCMGSNFQSKKVSQDITLPQKRYNLRPRKGDKEVEDENKIVTTRKRKMAVDKMRPSNHFFADFIHSLVDGMALTASFYTSPTVGAATTTAVLFYKLPHNIRHFTTLLKAGSTNAQRAQLITTILAHITAFVGIALHELVRHFERRDHGATVKWHDAILSVVAGGYLYFAIISVSTKSKDRIHSIKELLSMVFGLIFMVFISWNE
ncbi:hypothetical protein K501DRAFT_133788, partial [Backusella circina FSU 941]